MKNDYHDFRGYAGRLAGGVFRVGDKVKALPSGFTSKIKSIVTMDGDLQEAFAPQSVTITLEDEIDISRGDMIVRENNMPQSEQEFDVMLCWMNEKKMVPRGKYILRHTARECKCIVKETKYKLNINTLQRLEDDLELGLNDIGRVTIRTTVPLFFDSYRKNRITGSIILVDEATNETVAAGMIV
jgi:sulfate adenylyltransferase subunit 1